MSPARRSAAPAHQLDAAWLAVVEHLRAAALVRGALVTGGRSSGARVACRTAAATGADAVLCLAFPLEPPRRQGRPPSPSRLPELDAVTVPTLVVQGERDRFGIPPEGRCGASPSCAATTRSVPTRARSARRCATGFPACSATPTDAAGRGIARHDGAVLVLAAVGVAAGIASILVVPIAP